MPRICPGAVLLQIPEALITKLFTASTHRYGSKQHSKLALD